MSALLGTVRASAFSEALDCPLRFEARHLRGLRTPSSGAAAIGTSIHAGTALFDQARLDGRDARVDEAIDATIGTLQSPAEEVRWTDDDPPIGGAQKIAATLTYQYCTALAPQREYIAVEMRLDGLQIGTEHGVIEITGTTDRVRCTPDGELGICDLKSGKRAVDHSGAASTKGHLPQLAVYTVLAEQALQRPLDAPAEIIGLHTASAAAARIGTAQIADAKRAAVGDENGPGVIEIVAAMLKSGIFHGNPRSQLCSAKYCPIYPCRFVGAQR